MNIEDYVCPECGATADSKTFDTCDYCVIKFFVGDPSVFMVINAGKTSKGCGHDKVDCPEHQGGYDCTPFCPTCEGNQSYCPTCDSEVN